MQANTYKELEQCGLRVGHVGSMSDSPSTPKPPDVPMLPGASFFSINLCSPAPASQHTHVQPKVLCINH